MKPIVIIGLGATGFSCVEYFYNRGVPIKVIDTRENPPNLNKFNKLFKDTPLYLGGLYEPWLLQADKLVVSPGISLDAPEIQKAVSAGVTITNDIQIFIDALQQKTAKPKIVAITGSNGKSTVVKMVESIANSAKLNVAVGGNIGIPVLSLLTKDNTDLFVLELSSFQLDVITNLPVDVATVLNITPDHLDRHKTIAAYSAAKNKIYNQAITAVYNSQDLATYPQNINNNANLLSFTNDVPQEDQFGIIQKNANTYLAGVTKSYIATAELPLSEEHNILNALAAIVLSVAVDINDFAITDGLQKFTGLEHRCQFVGNYNGINWFNDSKATNVGSTVACLMGLRSDPTKGITLLAGGDGKDADFTQLADTVKRRVKNLIVYGKDANKIARSLAGCCLIYKSNTLQQAVTIAKDIAKKFETVVLSPACGSLDMFDSFAHRGEVFTRLVPKIHK